MLPFQQLFYRKLFSCSGIKFSAPTVIMTIGVFISIPWTNARLKILVSAIIPQQTIYFCETSRKFCVYKSSQNICEWVMM